MGLLVDGVWHDQWYDTHSTDGRFVRQESRFRHWVTPDGSSGFPAAAGRYHLYVSLACPWAHRTLIFRALKSLQDAIGVSVVDSLMLENGWELSEDADPVNGARYLYDIYVRAQPSYTGRVTVPVLWDRESATIVNNESADIIRMLNASFADLVSEDQDFYPETLQDDIDAVNERVYHTVNNGVYRCGFATSQSAYDEAFDQLFTTLDWLEGRLSRQRYLVGGQITEADWRLFTTLVRFDAVYHGHFKCNWKRITDYPSLWPYLRELYQVPGVAETVDFTHIKTHCYGSHRTVNPSGIVPRGPEIHFMEPHGRT